MVPFQALQMVGHTVHAVCHRQEDRRASADRDTRLLKAIKPISEKRGAQLATLNATFEEVKPADYDALANSRRPGAGISPPERAGARSRLRHFDKAGKPIAALCHGPQLLAAAGVLKGRKLNAYPACAPEVELAGGTFVKVDFSEAVVDGNLVTGPAWTAHPAWLAKFLDVLEAHLANKAA